jgi:hypothetical protein
MMEILKAKLEIECWHCEYDVNMIKPLSYPAEFNVEDN